MEICITILGCGDKNFNPAIFDEFYKHNYICMESNFRSN